MHACRLSSHEAYARPPRFAPCDGELLIGRASLDAGVVKLVDTPDLGSGGESLGGSSPFARTIALTLERN